MSTPRPASLPLGDEVLYQLVKRAEMNPSEVEDASLQAVEVTVLWERSVLQVAHLSGGEGFALCTREEAPRGAKHAVAVVLAGAATMLAGAATAGAPVAAAGALLTAGALGYGIARQARVENTGAERGRFVVDAALLGRDALKVITRDARFVFPADAAGEVSLNGASRSLRALVDAGVATPSAQEPGAYEVGLRLGGRYRLEIAGLTVQARVVAGARPVAPAPRLDRGIVTAALGALCLVGSALGALHLSVADDARLNNDDAEARLADLRDFVAHTREQVTPPATGATEAAATEARTPHAAAGTAGRPDTQAHNRQAFRPRPPSPSPSLPPRDNVSRTGIFAAMSNQGRPLPSAFEGLLPSGDASEDHVGNVTGLLPGDGEGTWGIGPVGPGVSTGGDGRDILRGGPLDTVNRGCPPGETCRVGDTVGRVPTAPRPTSAPRVRPSQPEVVGLPPEMIRRVVLLNLPRVNHCYQQGLATDPSLQGRVAVRFVINSSGAVIQSQVAESTLASPSVGQCIAASVGRLTFTMPDGAGVVRVTYPFSLMPADR